VADTKRLLLLKGICEYLLSEIRLSNGYNFDLAAAYRGKKNFGKETKLPAVVVLENFNPDRAAEVIGGVVGTKQKYDQVYLLNGWAAAAGDDEADEDAAHLLLGDVKKALGKLHVPRNQSGYFDGLASAMFIEPGVVRPPDEQSERAYFWMRIRLEVVEKVGDPYWIRD
jgi:hypothetical protein